MTFRLRHAACAAIALGALSACQRPVDLDLRDMGEGFSTTDAALNAGDPGLAPTAAPLPAVAPGAPAPAPDLITTAGAAIDRAGPVTTTSLAPVAPLAPVAAVAPVAPVAPPPVSASASSANVGGTSHTVARGETAYSIARLYGVSVRQIAEANSLGPDLAIREGQTLSVPAAGAVTAAAQPVPQPGQGSPTPTPPSAAAPLPQEPTPVAQVTPEPAPVPQNMGEQQTRGSDAQLAMPVAGSIIRAYAAGRNEGIDIGAPAGTEVRAAEAGTVAAVTTNTDGVQIVVIKHAGDLLTVYTHLDNLTVAKDARVSRGQAIGRVRPGEPSFLHFEVRRGMQSQDPTDFLP
jgi:murein DD-endopeptidase MepM/ murein hydrolase activator NlpD